MEGEPLGNIAIVSRATVSTLSSVAIYSSRLRFLWMYGYTCKVTHDIFNNALYFMREGGRGKGARKKAAGKAAGDKAAAADGARVRFGLE